VSALIATHNMALAARADRIITLQEGKVVATEPGRIGRIKTQAASFQRRT
jgi:ABC-type lipoprotein export system ATPase subunit